MSQKRERLTDLRSGQSAIVVDLDPPMHAAGTKRGLQGLRRGWGRRFVQRLMDMGLTPGIKLTVVKSAPFNGPLEVLVRGSRIVLGRGMASKVMVEVTR